MYKYKMDPAIIVEDTEWIWFRPQTDRQVDRRTRWNQYTPLTSSLGVGGVGIKNSWADSFAEADFKHLVYIAIEHVILKIYDPCKNFHMSSQYMNEPCKGDVYILLRK